MLLYLTFFLAFVLGGGGGVERAKVFQLRLISCLINSCFYFYFKVTIGVFGHEEKVIYEPLTPAAIQVVLLSKV